jgi:hypothetical protein
MNESCSLILVLVFANIGVCSCSSSDNSDTVPRASNCYPVDLSSVRVGCDCSDTVDATKSPMTHCGPDQLTGPTVCCKNGTHCVCYKVGCALTTTTCYCGKANDDGVTTTCTRTLCCLNPTGNCYCSDTLMACNDPAEQVVSQCRPQDVPLFCSSNETQVPSCK